MAASLAEAQDALRRRADELEAIGRRTAALLEPVFEQAPAGLAVFDEQMRFVRVNAALARMDGVPQEEHLGRTIGEVLPGMAGELGARLRDVIAERRTITDAELEGRTRARPGEARVWRASYFPVLADEGPPIGSGAIFVDITDHRRAERERRRLLVAERLAAAHTARLQEITSRLSRAVGAGDVAQVVVDQGVAALRAQAGVVVLLERGSSELRLAAQDGYDEREALDWRDLPLSDTAPLAEAVREGRVVAVVGRRELRERYPARAHVLERPGHRSWIAAPIRVGGEVRGGALFAFGVSRRLPDEDMRLLELLLAQAGPALDRAALYERQRHIASTLQRGLLPAHLPEIPGIDIAAVYRPAGDGNEVGGDFYDVVPTSGGRFVVAIGDVQGKGPEAAALTGLVRHTLRAETLHDADPAHLLRMLNRVVHRDDTDRFCTVALAAIEPGSRHVRVRVACGGHLPPIVTRRDEAPAGGRLPRDAARRRGGDRRRLRGPRARPRRRPRPVHRRRARRGRADDDADGRAPPDAARRGGGRVAARPGLAPPRRGRRRRRQAAGRHRDRRAAGDVRGAARRRAGHRRGARCRAIAAPSPAARSSAPPGGCP